MDVTLQCVSVTKNCYRFEEKDATKTVGGWYIKQSALDGAKVEVGTEIRITVEVLSVEVAS